MAVTWSTLDKHASLTLSNGNLTVSGGANGADRLIRSNAARFAGKYYWEFTAVNAVAGSTLCSVGLAFYSASTSTWLGSGTNSIGWYPNGDIVWNNGASIQTALLPYSAGDRISMAVDLTNRLLWVRVNGGNWNASGTANPATGTGGISFTVSPTTIAYHIAAVLGQAGPSYTLHATAASFQYAIPSGFKAFGASAVLNSVDKHGSVTLSNGDLTASVGTVTNNATYAIRSDIGYFRGKYYFEVTAGPNMIANWTEMGLATAAYAITATNTFLGATTASLGIYPTNATDAEVAFNNVFTPYGGLSFTAQGTVLSFAVDLENDKVWIRKNGGNWLNATTATQNPETNTGGHAANMVASVFAALALTQSNSSMTVNFGATAFAYAVPSGFERWTDLATSSTIIEADMNAAGSASTSLASRVDFRGVLSAAGSAAPSLAARKGAAGRVQVAGVATPSLQARKDALARVQAAGAAAMAAVGRSDASGGVSMAASAATALAARSEASGAMSASGVSSASFEPSSMLALLSEVSIMALSTAAFGARVEKRTVAALVGFATMAPQARQDASAQATAAGSSAMAAEGVSSTSAGSDQAAQGSSVAAFGGRVDARGQLFGEGGSLAVFFGAAERSGAMQSSGSAQTAFAARKDAVAVLDSQNFSILNAQGEGGVQTDIAVYGIGGSKVVDTIVRERVIEPKGTLAKRTD